MLPILSGGLVSLYLQYILIAKWRVAKCIFKIDPHTRHLAVLGALSDDHKGLIGM